MKLWRVVGTVLVLGASATPDARAQTLGVGTGVMLPVGESRSITDRSQSLTVSLAMPTRLVAVSVRADANLFRARSTLVTGAVATTHVLALSGVARPPKLPSLYGMAGAGVYRSSLSPTPMRVKPTADLGFNVGAGFAVPLGRKVAGRAGLPSWLSRLEPFFDSRLHHVLTDVNPTDFVEITGGIRVRLKS